VQGIKAFHDAKELPPTEMAILVVAAKFCPDYVEFHRAEKQVRAFIIISAGFVRRTRRVPSGRKHPRSCERYGCALIGPNCIGLMNAWYHGVFTKPIPSSMPRSDFISARVATAVFILESAVIRACPSTRCGASATASNWHRGLCSIWTRNFDPDRDSRIKLPVY
jgi:acetyltransferase